MSARLRPGRPRSESSRHAILSAARELAIELGYAGLTIEGIAARAGVGKQTIYRWWASKADVLLEASAADIDLQGPLADQGSYEADLRGFLESTTHLASRPEFVEVLRALMAESQIDREFGERFRCAFLEPERQALALITERAHGRGDLPRRPDPAMVPDVALGAIWYRILVSQGPLGADLIDELLALLAEARPERPRLLTLRPTEPAMPSPLPWRAAAE